MTVAIIHIASHGELDAYASPSFVLTWKEKTPNECFRRPPTTHSGGTRVNYRSAVTLGTPREAELGDSDSGRS